MFVLSFENENDRTSFLKYYVPNVEKKEFNVSIDGKIMKKHTNNLLKWKETMITRQVVYWISKHYTLITSDLSKQIELENRDLKQKINIIRRLPRNEGATIFFIIEKLKERTFEFS